MKKLGLLIAVFGIFALVGVASASTADQLQPASTITYNEELVVNATGRFDSVYIGSTEAGVGGVTFFNGTMINNSVDSNGQSTIPLTLGDDVRIDGEIYRTEVGGDNPLKLADTLRPQTTATYDLGTSTNEFRNAYFSGTVTTAALSGTGIVNTTNILDATIATADIADDAVTGDKIDATTDISVDAITATGALTGATATFSGDVAAQGDINQDLADNGAVKALVEINGDVDVAADCLVKSWTADDTTVACSKTATGVYVLTFDSSVDVDARYYSATATTDVAIVQVSAADNVVTVNSWNAEAAAGAKDADVMLFVY